MSETRSRRVSSTPVSKQLSRDMGVRTLRKNQIVRCLFAAVCVHFSTSGALANDATFEIDDRFSPTFYAGAGAGRSWLEPNTAKLDGWDVNQRLGTGGQINVGVDLLKSLSLELHSADLGSAGLSPMGRINYHVDGISALIYAGNNRGRHKRRGLTAYGRSGIGLLTNTAVGDVPFRKLNDSHLLLGAGLEYTLNNGVGARAEFITFDKDVSYGQIGMIYRFGKVRLKESKAPEDVQMEAPATITSTDSAKSSDQSELPAPPPPPIPPPLPAPTDTVSSKAPEPSTTVDEAGDNCFMVKEGITGIRFATGSAVLSPSIKRLLSDVALVLASCPELPVIVSAHTDNTGSAKTNQALSQARAWAVINYLRGAGVSLSRMTPEAFGETQPIDTNSTPKGRSNNRRVELFGQL